MNKILLFIDAAIQDHQQLLDGVKQGIEVIQLNAIENGVDQITRTLAERQDISQIHILSHGDVGQIQLGSEWLSADNLASHSEQLKTWHRSLQTNASLLLYGCHIAAGDRGVEFIQSLSQLTATTIAASNHLTASAALGGDWNLTATTGDITAELAFTPTVLATYPHALAKISLDSPIPIVEGNSGAQALTFTVRLDAAVSGRTVRVEYDINDGSATLADSDYRDISTPATRLSPTSGILEFLPGTTEQQITVEVLGDTKPESNEAFTVTINTPSALDEIEGTGIANGVIRNDDSLPTVSIENASLAEGTTGTQNLSFTVRLSAATGRDVRLSYQTSDGTATLADADYESKVGDIVIPRGQTQQTIAIPIKGDTQIESDETFLVTLTNVENATIATNQATGTITNDDDPPPIVSISAAVLEQAEGADPAPYTFNITLDKAPKAPITVTYSTLAIANGATANQDFTPVVGGTVTFTANDTQLSKPIQIQIIGDTIPESPEQFAVQIDSAVGADINPQANQAIGIIGNDDQPPQPIVAIAPVNATQPEGNTGPTAFTFNVTLSNAPTAPITVAYTIAGATPGTDYQDANPNTQLVNGQLVGSLTFQPNGVLTQQITVNVSGDTEVEPAETFTIQLTDAPGATLNSAAQSAIGTIQNDDTIAPPPPPVLPVVSISGPTPIPTAEGNAGSTTDFIYTVTLSAAPTQSVTVNYSTNNGSTNSSNSAAIADSDYLKNTATLTFRPGEPLSQTITVQVKGDDSFEANEDFTVRLDNATGATIDPNANQSIGSIINDDPSPSTLPIASISASVNRPEGNTGTTDFTYTVQLSEPVSQPVEINYSVVGDTATAGTDYSVEGSTASNGIFSGTLNFAPNEPTEKTITVKVNGDTTLEPNETFVVRLDAASNATLGSAQATGTIENDEQAALPSISVEAIAPIEEGNSGVTRREVVVTLSAPSQETVAVRYATADGTATVGDRDYVSISPAEVLLFQPGETRKTFNIGVRGDTLNESDETFLVNLTSVRNATIATPSTPVTILTDDTNLPRISINDAAVSEGNDGNRNAEFTVSLTEASAQPVTVQYRTIDGTATIADNDYIAANGTLTFEPGQRTKTIAVNVRGDAFREADETFTVTLSTPNNATIAIGTGNGRIINDDITAPGTNPPGTNPPGTNPNDPTRGNADSDEIINIFGTARNDTLIGGNERNALWAVDGNDTLRGGGGDDILYGGNGNDRLSGEDGNDRILGRRGSDRLSGGNGNDFLVGGFNDDRLTGGAGADQFAFFGRRQGIDTITDFNVSEDTLAFSGEGFRSGLKLGPLRAAQFQRGKAARDSSDRFIYDAGSGSVWFDRDGSGSAKAVLMARLTPGLNLTARNIVIIEPMG